MPRFELCEGTSNKFCEITLEGDSFVAVWGRIGTKGQSATKTFDSPAKAQAEHDKLVAEKVRKGYALVGAAAPVAAATNQPPTPPPTLVPQPRVTKPQPAAAVPVAAEADEPLAAPQVPSPEAPAPSSQAAALVPVSSFEISSDIDRRARREVTHQRSRDDNTSRDGDPRIRR